MTPPPPASPPSPRPRLLGAYRDWYGRNYGIGGADTPQFTPDGNRMIFSRPEADALIYSICPDGTGRQWIENGATAALSPDGKRIAFLRHGKLFLMDSDGWNAHVLTDASEDRPQFSLDGSLLVFRPSKPSNALAIYQLTGPNAGEVIISSASDPGRARLMLPVTFGPDGGNMVYAKNIYEITGDIVRQHVGLFMSNMDFTNEVQLTANPMDSAPLFTPDGEYILFIRRTAAGDQLCRISPAGGEVHTLLNAYNIEQFALAPDGKHLLYIAHPELDTSLGRSNIRAPETWHLP